MFRWERKSLRAAFACSGLSVALLASLGFLSPVEAGVLWRSADGARVMVRNSAGLPVVVDNVVPKLPVSTTGGAGAMRAGQLVTVPGASTELTLSRAITAANIARGLRIASSLGSIVGLAGLAYEGIIWATDHWETPADLYARPSGVSDNRNWRSSAPCANFSDHCGFSQAVSAFVAAKNTGYQTQTEVTGFSIASGDCMSSASLCTIRVDFKYWHTAGQLWATGYGFIDSTGSDGPSAGVGGVATDAQVETSFTNALQADPTKAGPMIEWIAEAVPEYDFQPGPIEVSGPSSVAGPVTTTTKQEGGQTYTTTNQTTYNFDYSGDVVTVTTTTVSTTVDASNNVVSQSTTTTQAPASPEQVPAPQEKPKDPCGLPGTPACKIDETGTPTAESTVSAGQGALATAMNARDAQVAEKTGVTSWGWLLPVPTLTASCSSINVAGLFTLDPCPALDISRMGFSWLWAVLAGLYCWRRVGETVSGGV